MDWGGINPGEARDAVKLALEGDSPARLLDLLEGWL